MQKIPDDLNGALALNICRTRDGWEASLERSKGSFSIATGATPSAAIAGLFAASVAAVPVCPIPHV
jgi:hypothetical protein